MRPIRATYRRDKVFPLGCFSFRNLHDSDVGRWVFRYGTETPRSNVAIAVLALRYQGIVGGL